MPGMTGIERPHRLSLAHIERAATQIDPLFRDSPQYECEPPSQALGARITLKVETLNPLRSFKGRGADFFMQENAARLAGRVLVCATAANPLKVAHMRAMGAEVRLHSNDFDAAKDEARRFCRDSGAVFVEDGREASIAEGAGRWAQAHVPGVRVVGVCAAAADAMAASWRLGRKVARDTAPTIADGIAVRQPVDEALVDMQGTVDEVVLVIADVCARSAHDSSMAGPGHELSCQRPPRSRQSSQMVVRSELNGAYSLGTIVWWKRRSQATW